jgi:hypothetical protein
LCAYKNKVFTHVVYILAFVSQTSLYIMDIFALFSFEMSYPSSRFYVTLSSCYFSGLACILA